MAAATAIAIQQRSSILLRQPYSGRHCFPSMQESPASPDPLGEETPPNVVLVTAHDLGRHLGCYGRDVSTPRIDEFAADGVRFERNFATAPQCCPSRASMLTGQYPHENGMLGLVHRGWSLDADVRTLPEYLRTAGYETHVLGLQHVAATDERAGFDHRHCEIRPPRGALDVADTFEDLAPDLAEEGPFYAQIGCTEVHSPWRREYVDDGAYAERDPDDLELPHYLADAETRRSYADFVTLLEEVLDPVVGRIVDAVERAGLAQDTLVCFTTDHGIAFGMEGRRGAKCHPTDAGLGIATILRHPTIDAGVCDALCSNVDLTPTILECCGVDVHDGLSGRSVRGAFDDTTPGHEPRERIFAEQTWHGGKLNPFRAVRTADRKYVRNFSPRTQSGGSFPDAHLPIEECYDLTTDPEERTNVAPTRRLDLGPPVNETRWTDGTADPDPAYAADVDGLRDALRSWMDRTDDPLGDGCVPLSGVDTEW
jgi:arylsulfatase A-like enzyme